jgi:DNA-binding IclR family transcriptional regulator
MKEKEIEKEKEKDAQDRYSIYSIEKAFDVIEMLSDHETLSLIELTERLHQPKSSLYRIILTLEKLGYVTRDDGDGKYCLGYKSLVITRKLLEKSSIRVSSIAEMNRLVDKYGDTVNLGVLSDNHVLYLEIIEGTNALRMTDTVGSKAPLHASAMGKVIMSYLSKEEVHEILAKIKLFSITANTIIVKREFLNELTKIRKQGYALDDQEIVQGARCVAAPIFDMFGKIQGAVSLSGALHRFSDLKLSDISEDVREASLNISRKMGYVESAGS